MLPTWSSSEVSGCLAAKNTQLCEQTLAVILASRLSEQQNSRILAFTKDFEANTLKVFFIYYDSSHFIYEIPNFNGLTCIGDFSYSSLFFFFYFSTSLVCVSHVSLIRFLATPDSLFLYFPSFPPFFCVLHLCVRNK